MTYVALASCADLAPITRRSGSSIRGKNPFRRGTEDLERALFLFAFAAIRDAASRDYYDREVGRRTG